MTEGGDSLLDHTAISAMDVDVPKEKLVLTVLDPPAHGTLTLVSQRPGVAGAPAREAPMHDITVDDLQGNMQVRYRHGGGEETEDSFTLKVGAMSCILLLRYRF